MSTFRTFAVPKTSPTNVVTINTLAYDDNVVGEYMPIPFTVQNGVLDIAIQDGVTASILTPASYDNDYSDQPYFQASIMSGLSPVSSLGPTMLTFLKNFIADYENNVEDYNLVTNIQIYNAPTMIKIRLNHISNERAYQFDTVAPVKTTTDPVSGDSSNNYRVVSIFKSPLVVSYKYDGNPTKYLTFTSAFDAQ
jgi:hypothetical protein